jgi:hypothetical protein
VTFSRDEASGNISPSTQFFNAHSLAYRVAFGGTVALDIREHC